MNENEKKIENLMSSINDYRMANKKHINELVVSLVNEIAARDNAMSQLKSDETNPDYSGLKPEDIGQTSTPPSE